MIPVNYGAEFTLEEILQKNESLNTLNTTDKLFKFLTKLLDNNKFKIELKEDKYILAGYIAPGQTGINGSITITAFIDADQIAITDTYDVISKGKMKDE